MKIIVSHLSLDFDGLAAMIAASKLYPDYKIVLPEKLSSSVEEFLALYKDVIPLFEKTKIEFSKIKKIVVVDTNSADRLGVFYEKIQENIEIIVWDHHPLTKDSIKAEKKYISQVGATTTLLVEEIKKKDIILSSFEATILALGIYSDTGSLLFNSTTPKDIHMAAYLLEKGANLDIVSRFLGRPLEVEEKEILQDLLKNMETIDKDGIKILLSYCQYKNYVGGLSLLAHRIIELTGAEVLFIVVEMAKKIFIVGRSSIKELQVDDVVNKYGGGGHTGAGAAIIRDTNLMKAYFSLKNTVLENVKPSIMAKEIMSTPVKTILPATKVKQAANIMLRYGHTGLPIVEDGKLLGIISRRDIDKALHHDLGHAPVKAYMKKNIKKVTPETSLLEIEKLLIENNIGRLPVVDTNHLVGIVTRSDVLKKIHGENIKKHDLTKHQLGSLDIRRRLKSFLSSDIYNILLIIEKIAHSIEVNAYLVGGVVRDLILNKKNKDLDIVIEGDGILFAEKLVEKCGGKINSHKKFKTSKVELDNNIKLDIATSRVEFYAYPAALPEVEKAHIRHDLYRRDFTINAMAISLNKGSFGKLIDHFCGFKDLKNGQVRVLHSLSFVEDPTRILRAVKFEIRYGFTMEPDTSELCKKAVENLKNVSKPRLFEEFRHLLKEVDALKCILRLKELDALKYILGTKRVNEQALFRLQDIIFLARKEGLDFSPYLLYFGLLAIENERIYSEISSLGLLKKEINLLNKLQNIKIYKSIFQNLQGKIGEVHKNLKDFDVEVCLLASVFYSSDLGVQKIIKYLFKRLNYKVHLKGDDLRSLGVSPGPLYSKIFKELKIAILNEEVHNKKDEIINWVKTYLESEGSKCF